MAAPDHVELLTARAGALRLEDEQPVLYKARCSDSGVATHQVSSVVERVPDTSSTMQRDPRPQESDHHEILACLKVKTSMLALGACERIKRLSRVYPQDMCASPVLPELIHILEEGPGTPLAAAALSALSTLALHPEGRQRIVILGAAPPVIRLVARCDLNRPNTLKAVQLLMNLAADAQNRRVIREAGGVEALVALSRVAPPDEGMEQALGALHNVMLTDSKAKARAVEAGIAYSLARVLGRRLPEGEALSVRGRMLLTDLLRIPDLQERIVAAATELKLHIPGMMGQHLTATSRRETSTALRISEIGAATSRAGGSTSGTPPAPAQADPEAPQPSTD